MQENDKLAMQLIKKNFLISILGVTLIVICPRLIGQNNAALSPAANSNDINIMSTDTAKREYKHYPRIAALASVILPGLGQVYNRKYWKTPVIWGIGIGLYAYYETTNSYYFRFKNAYEQLNKEELVSDPELVNTNLDGLYYGKEKYRHHRDMALIYMGVLYIANILDALVDAHMLDYDISQDLSLHWQPTLTQPNSDTYSATTVGLNIQLNF